MARWDGSLEFCLVLPALVSSPANKNGDRDDFLIKEHCGRRTAALRGMGSTDPQPHGIGGPSPLRFGADELSHEPPMSPAALTK
jgi:hypothetical protein